MAVLQGLLTVLKDACHPGLLVVLDEIEVEPAVTQRAITDLKFADLLPEALARATRGERLADHLGAAAAARRSIVERRTG